ncbi:MAG: hypothetical protein IKY23_07365 [Lachnospiraceae bacterium]|nr:hypothetical protein [Lachnospiraceae bacterium]
MSREDWKEERERRNQIRMQINGLRNRIGEINSEITKMREIIYFYQDIKRSIQEKAEAWGREYARYGALDLAPNIQVTDSFEGMAARQLSMDVPQTVDRIQLNSCLMSDLIPGIADQIKKIEDYIVERELEKQRLQAQIDALLGEL